MRRRSPARCMCAICSRAACAKPATGCAYRDLTDILAVQTDIAHAISAALQRTLGTAAEAATARRPTPIDRDAYRHYLQAKDLAYRGNEDDLNRAVELLRRATEKAPGFANGYV